MFSITASSESTWSCWGSKSIAPEPRSMMSVGTWRLTAGCGKIATIAPLMLTLGKFSGDLCKWLLWGPISGTHSWNIGFPWRNWPWPRPVFTVTAAASTDSALTLKFDESDPTRSQQIGNLVNQSRGITERSSTRGFNSTYEIEKEIGGFTKTNHSH